MEHPNESEINDKDVKEDDDLSITEDRRRSSSSSISSISEIESAATDFTCDDSSQIDRHEHADDVPDVALETQVINDESALQSPPIQVMEQPAEKSGYRIPSYVFARDKSNNPEWSICSNESLFSIHNGGMSFTGDQFSWLQKSGELGKPWELPPPSPTNVGEFGKDEVPVPIQETLKSGEEITTAHFKTTPPNEEVQNTLPLPANQQVDDLVGMKKADKIIEAKDKTSSVTSDESTHSKRVSHRSEASGQSFAFPVLAEIGREKSLNSGQIQTQDEPQKESKEIVDNEKTKTSPKATTEATPTFFSSWIPSCFKCSCCC